MNVLSLYQFVIYRPQKALIRAFPYFLCLCPWDMQSRVFRLNKDGEYTPCYYGFGENGCMLKGWQFLNGYVYYFDPASGLMMT